MNRYRSMTIAATPFALSSGGALAKSEFATADDATSKANFQQDDKSANPVARTIEPKSMHCERLERTVVCGGLHKN
jgi:hypothetical protein